MIEIHVGWVWTFPKFGFRTALCPVMRPLMNLKGDYKTIEEIAEAENINPSYVSWVLRMKLLVPKIVEAILAGRQPEGLTMARAMQPFPIEWKHQQSGTTKALT
jgi:hypothetical protein